MSEFKTLFINDLKLDQEYQARNRTDDTVVKEYEAVIVDGGIFPPIQVVKVGSEQILVDGFHRVRALLNQGRDRVEAEVTVGDRGLALKMAIGANQTHGLRRTNADKVKAISMALNDFELSCKSDRELAQLCGVSAPTVASVRERLGQPKSQSKFARQIPNKPISADVKKFTPQVFSECSEPSPSSEIQTQFDASQELNDILQEEIQQLKDTIAHGFMDGTEAEKNLAMETIEELRKELQLTKIELEAVKISRNTYQNENNQMRKQIAWLTKRNKRLNDQLGKNERLDEERLPS